MSACFSGRDYVIGRYAFAMARTTGGWLGVKRSWYGILIQSTATSDVMYECMLSVMTGVVQREIVSSTCLACSLASKSLIHPRVQAEGGGER